MLAVQRSILPVRRSMCPQQDALDVKRRGSHCCGHFVYFLCIHAYVSACRLIFLFTKPERFPFPFPFHFLPVLFMSVFTLITFTVIYVLIFTLSISGHLRVCAAIFSISTYTRRAPDLSKRLRNVQCISTTSSPLRQLLALSQRIFTILLVILGLCRTTYSASSLLAKFEIRSVHDHEAIMSYRESTRQLFFFVLLGLRSLPEDYDPCMLTTEVNIRAPEIATIPPRVLQF